MRIHCIGIGGIGVSSIAQYYLAKGHEVSGSDLVASEITESLAKRGVRVLIGNSSDHVTDAVDLVVYSPAVQKRNPELARALSLGLKTQSYPEALGDLTRQYYTIAISGAHGKSTTTALTALILEKAGLDPTVIVGTKLKEYGNTNFRLGHSKYLVIEACEYDGSFLNYDAKIIAITNIDKEHLDYFKTFANVKKTFKEFIKKLPKDGFLVANKDDKNMPKIPKAQFETRYFSLKQKEAAQVKKVMQVPGKHNVANGLAAMSVARILGVPDKVSLKSLSEFTGSWRRFEVSQRQFVSDKLKAIRYTLVSDYGHHPNEVKATLQAAREKYPNKKIWLVFQPHQYQRTFYLFKDFVKVFQQAPIDSIIVTDIYDVAGREETSVSSQVSSAILVKKINRDHVKYMTVTEIESHLKKNIKSREVLLIMGAGTIYKLADQF